MNRVAFAASLVLALGAASARAGDGPQWLDSYADGLKAAKEQNKPMLLEFTSSDATGDCAKLKAEVIDAREFADWSAQVVLVAIDFPKEGEQTDDQKKANEALKTRFKVKDLPTIVFVDAKEKELGRTGYVEGGAAAWLKSANSALGLQAEAGGGEWLDNYDEAVKRAKKEKKLILADFTGSDWCPWCIKLHDEVFSTQEFKDWAAANVILLELDFPRKKELPAAIKTQNEKLQSKYNISGFPTVLFLDVKGKEKGRTGYVAGGPEAWLDKDARKVAGDRKVKKAAPKSP